MVVLTLLKCYFTQTTLTVRRTCQISRLELITNRKIKMSLASKITLWTTCIGTASTILYVHFRQFVDREKIHDGVVRDVERQERRKIENIYMLQQQIELTKHLKDMEKKSNSSNTESEMVQRVDAL